MVMQFSRLTPETYTSLNGVLSILLSKEGFWYYRFTGFIEGKILISYYTYKDYYSCQDFLRRTITHKMKEFETGSTYTVIVDKRLLTTNHLLSETEMKKMVQLQGEQR